MILEKSELFKSFFGEKYVQGEGRIECFFRDMQRTMDTTGAENIQLLLLIYRKLIYQGKKNKIEEKYIPAIKKLADVQYQDILCKIDFFSDACQTLFSVEKQQRARERQIECNYQDPPPLLRKNVSDKFFERIFERKQEHGFYTRKGKEEIIQGYKTIYAQCSNQPITAAMLPLILTIYSTDECTPSHLYVYFKYKNRRLTRQLEKELTPLLLDICDLVNEYIATDFQVPIFKWDTIVEDFCRHHKLGENDSKEVKEYFADYCQRNAIPKGKESSLLKLSYGRDVRSLAKLFNLNTMLRYSPIKDSLDRDDTVQFTDKAVPQVNLRDFLTARKKIEDEQNQALKGLKTNKQVQRELEKIKRLYKQLEEGDLLPLEDVCSNGTVKFNRRICTFASSSPDFCLLALHRYYGIPFGLNVLCSFGVNMLETYFESALDEYVVQLKKNFSSRILHWSVLEKKSEWRDYLSEAYKFASRVCVTFTDYDYREFISKGENFLTSRFVGPEEFEASGFRVYLRKFCKKYRLAEYTDAPKEKAELFESVAFDAILNLASTQLHKNFISYWQKNLSEELFRKSFQGGISI